MKKNPNFLFRWQTVSLITLCVLCSLLFVVSGCGDSGGDDDQQIEHNKEHEVPGDDDDQQIEPEDENEDQDSDNDGEPNIEPDDEDEDQDSDDDEVQPLSHDEISSNLLKMGSADLELLVGEWECVRVAYTADGNEISNVATLSKCQIEIGLTDGWFFDPPLDTANINLYIFLKVYIFYYSTPGNRLICNENLFTYLVNLPWSDNEIEVKNILMNTYSFVMKGDELIIYFTGVKNKNLLILRQLSKVGSLFLVGN